MPENRDSRITDAMVEAAARALHLQMGDHPELYRYGGGEEREWVAWTDAARAAIDAAARAEREGYPVRAVTLPELGVSDGAAEAGLTGLLAAYPQWWCRSCGNRYADLPSVIEDGCSCGGGLQPVTVQLVAREA